MALKIKQDPKRELSLFKREVLSLVFLAIGVFLYLSLFTYDTSDPSFSSISSLHIIQNWGGVLGAYLADLLIVSFGGGAYFIGVFFIFLAVIYFSGIRKRFSAIDIPIYLVFVVLISILFQLSQGVLYFKGTTLDAGGVIGRVLAELGVNYLGLAGCYLLVLLGALLTFVWATQLSLKVAFSRFIFAGRKLFNWVSNKIVLAWARLGRALEKLKDKKTQRPQPIQIESAKSAPLKNEIIFKPKSDQPFIPPAPVQVASPVAFQRPVQPKILDRTDKKKPAPAQMEFTVLKEGYQLPPINLLDSGREESVRIDEESLKHNARLLEKKFLDFGVEGAVTEIHPGPVITMYEFQPAPGVKLSRIANLVDDLSLAMGGRSVRIVAPLPNKPAVGIEIPNNERETVWLKDVIGDEKFQKSESKLLFALGKDIEGIPYVADLARMPHLLVAGATGSGKSVSINTMILSFLYKASPQEVRIIMVDPKMLELSIYEGIPHLLLPVVTEPKKAALALRWAVREMERRYKLLSDLNARDIKSYNKRLEKGGIVGRQEQRRRELGLEGTFDEETIRHEEALPYIVIIIDELADLMMVAGREVEEAITRLAQMARAAGIHLILATQRPSVDVITGVIKANFPARIAFKVSARHDSRTVLDAIGAERLLGNGDMLIIPPGTSQVVRAHGAFITDTEVSRVVEFLKKQGKPVYNEAILKPLETDEMGMENEEDGESDALYDQAVSIVAETKQASISMIQRKLRVGYNRAARMIEKMEHEGIVSPPTGAGHRQVLVSSLGGE